MRVRGTVTALEEAGALAAKTLEDNDEPGVPADATPVEEGEEMGSKDGSQPAISAMMPCAWTTRGDVPKTFTLSIEARTLEAGPVDLRSLP